MRARNKSVIEFFSNPAEAVGSTMYVDDEMTH
jgi:hypothetical protein